MRPKPRFGALLWHVSLLTLSFPILPPAESANIVFFLGLSTYSHRLPMWPLAEALAESGHNVTFISPHAAKSPNPKIVDYVPPPLKEWADSWGGLLDFFGERKRGNSMSAWGIPGFFGTGLCNVLYSDTDYVRWVRSAKVDLVFMDGFFNECVYGMVHLWGAKIIMFQTLVPLSHHLKAYGLPDETSTIPSIDFVSPVEMTFVQRMTNVLNNIAWVEYRKYSYLPQLEAMTKEKLGISDMPRFEDIERNTSMAFFNTHYSEEFARAMPPSAISVAGIGNTGTAKQLPKDLDSFVSKGEDFIYISFGSHVDFFTMDKEIQQAFIGAMNSLSHLQFVWKIGNNSLEKYLTKGNVYMSNWMPQLDLLAHPNIRAFITHSGLNSMHEAIHAAVPLICFPFFAEQDQNAGRVEWKESGIRLEITTVTQAELVEAIKNIISNPKYRNNMKKSSKLFRERPMKPLETAMWWTEFVLRHSQEELAALRPLNLHQFWWTRRQLDVWLTVATVIVGFLMSLIYVICKLVACVMGRNRSTSANTLSKSGRQMKKVQ